MRAFSHHATSRNLDRQWRDVELFCMNIGHLAGPSRGQLRNGPNRRGSRWPVAQTTERFQNRVIGFGARESLDALASRHDKTRAAPCPRNERLDQGRLADPGLATE